MYIDIYILIFTKDVFKYVHSNIIFNQQKLETAQVFTEEWINKL